MNWKTKIKGGALQFVLFIGAIIAVLLMAFLLISHTHNFFDKKTALTIRLIQAAEEGLYYSFSEQMETGESLSFFPENEKGIEVTIKKEFWGAFDIRKAYASHQKTQYTKTVLVGAKKTAASPALYLKDNQRPLVLAGKAKITGDAFLPAQGIRMGNIAGNSYRYDQLLFGKQLQSGSALPALNTALLQNIQRLLEGTNSLVTSSITLEPQMDLKNSFDSPVTNISGSVLHLDEISLTGNIIVSASQKIIVTSTSVLQDVILIAPEIIIEDKVRGSFQALATKHIGVGKDCVLSYPSALVVYNKQKNQTTSGDGSRPNLTIATGSLIKGVLLYLDESESRVNYPQIKLDDKTILEGEIYCSKNIELKGQVFGSITTEGFVALENGSIYQNHLYNGQINSEALNPEYCGLLFKNTPSKSIMKWLY